ncbi:MAG: DNA mismatch repair endonuclease MutL [Clostridia bacterium]|nr:DNA mismatch repair endonuclease MutL [Clostridia bacterium]
MGKIILLDELTSCQIAAGEVVERPASVVKETVENSIDAGSTRISVEIKNGGIKYIRIDDNGSGMEADDCIIAFDKHATSKLRCAEDLFNISTLGFRGEALASIAAVSKVTLKTKTEEAEAGTFVIFEGGELVDTGACGMKKGTQITVENLFYNTPARYKFLKRDQTEASYVADVMEKFALSHPEISFKLVSDGKQIMFSPGGSLGAVVYGLYGKSIFDRLKEVGFKVGNVEVTGYCGTKELTYGNRSRENVFVNGRFVKSKTVLSAIDEAYKQLVMKGKFPFVILNIKMPAVSVDVNVHPAKTEVRFADDNTVFRAVTHAVYNALYGVTVQEQGSEQDVTKPAAETVSNLKETDIVKTMAEAASQNANPVKETVVPARTETQEHTDVTEKEQASFWKNDTASEPVIPENKGNSDITENQSTNIPDPQKDNVSIKYYAPEATSNNDGFIASDPAAGVAYNAEGNRNAESLENLPVYRDGRVVGQIFDTYIVIEHDDSLYLLDQHAAHERLKYEEIRKALASRENESQQLLLPQTVTLGASEYMKFENVRQTLEDLGFEIDDFGSNTLIIRAIPSLITPDKAEDFVVTAIGSARPSEGRTNVFNDYAVYTMACKAAIKANRKLSDVEIRALLDDLVRVKNPGTCPHGRPILIKWSKYEIERKFHRA